jgi:hypothetical protein
VRVLFDRQVQHRIGHRQVRCSRRPVRHPGHGHFTEHRGQTALVTEFDAGVRHPGGVGDPLLPLFTDRSQVQVVLKQLPHQRPGVHRQPFLQLGMGLPAGTRIGQHGDHRLEQRPGPLECGHRHLGRVP